MFKGKRILAVVPARGGSKGVPLKNIRPVLGLPLISYTAKFLQQFPEIDRKVVSTDHAEIARVAREAGLDVPFMRPESLAGDFIGDCDVLKNALQECERIDQVTYDIVLMLQPTSPLRTKEDVVLCLQKLIDGNLDSVWTLSEVNVKYHPLKQLILEGDELKHYSADGKKIIARQQLGKTYIRNGVLYAISRDCLLKQNSIIGGRAGGVLVSHPIVNIDNLEDFNLLESHLSKNPAARERPIQAERV